MKKAVLTLTAAGANANHAIWKP